MALSGLKQHTFIITVLNSEVGLMGPGSRCRQGCAPGWRLRENEFPPLCQLLEATCMLGSWGPSSSVKASNCGGNPLTSRAWQQPTFCLLFHV